MTLLGQIQKTNGFACHGELRPQEHGLGSDLVETPHCHSLSAFGRKCTFRSSSQFYTDCNHQSFTGAGEQNSLCKARDIANVRLGKHCNASIGRREATPYAACCAAHHRCRSSSGGGPDLLHSPPTVAMTLRRHMHRTTKITFTP